MPHPPTSRTLTLTLTPPLMRGVPQAVVGLQVEAAAEEVHVHPRGDAGKPHRPATHLRARGEQGGRLSTEEQCQ